MKTRSIIRSLYLYVFALVGLVMLAIGGVRLLDLGLRALIFTEAEQQERIYARPMPPTLPGRNVDPETTEGLTPEERQQLRQWMAEYEQWQAMNEEVDPVLARRHRDASSGLALILIGFPIYFYHWRLIRKEAAERPDAADAAA
ncbi:MAG TPA: hypothetical protein VNZ57_03495 [Longimicrobiales bacterium]|nr:hypothetical protein [Longimicrobiales bacterium]